MIDRNRNRIGLAVGIGAAFGLVGCSTVEVEMSGSPSYLIEPAGSGLGPGPSLIAGDQLAFHMVLAGAYDAPAFFDGTGYATVPTEND